MYNRNAKLKLELQYLWHYEKQSRNPYTLVSCYYSVWSKTNISDWKRKDTVMVMIIMIKDSNWVRVACLDIFSLCRYGLDLIILGSDLPILTLRIHDYKWSVSNLTEMRTSILWNSTHSFVFGWVIADIKNKNISVITHGIKCDHNGDAGSWCMHRILHWRTADRLINWAENNIDRNIIRILTSRLKLKVSPEMWLFSFMSHDHKDITYESDSKRADFGVRPAREISNYVKTWKSDWKKNQK